MYMHASRQKKSPVTWKSAALGVVFLTGNHADKVSVFIQNLPLVNRDSPSQTFSPHEIHFDVHNELQCPNQRKETSQVQRLLVHLCNKSVW